MVCTAGMDPGCGVDRALCPISVSSGLTADLTSNANQLVMALVTWQVKSRNPQLPVPAAGAGSGDGDGDGEGDGAAGAAGARRAAVTVAVAAGRAGPAASARCEPPATTIRAAHATASASTAARRPRLRRGGPGRAGRRVSLIRRSGTSGRSR